MDKYNGWIEPWRVTRLERVLCTWTNHVIGSRCAHVHSTRDFCDSLALAHLVSLVLDTDVFNTPHTGGMVLPRPLSQDDVLHNARVLLSILKDADIKVMCHAHDIEAGDRERIVWLLTQIAQHAYVAKLSHYYPALPTPKLPHAALYAATHELLPRLSSLPPGLAHAVPTEKSLLSDLKSPDSMAALLWALCPAALDVPALLSLSENEDRMGTLLHAGHQDPLNLPHLLLPSDVARVEELSLSMWLAELAIKARAEPGLSSLQGPGEGPESKPEGEDFQALANQLQIKIESLEDQILTLQDREAKLQVELYDTHSRSAPIANQVDELESVIRDLKSKLAAASARALVLERQKNEILTRAQEAVTSSKAKREAAEARFKRALDASQELSKKFKRMKLQMEVRAREQEASAKANKGVVAPGSVLFNSPEYDHLFSSMERPADASNIHDVGPNPVVIMFTDIQGSTSLWEKDAESMAQALTVHNEVFRSFLPRMSGYEVKTEGDAFMVAFESPVDAIVCALTLQRELLRCDWPESILDTPMTRETRDRFGQIIWRGLRVRMALHYGTPELRMDPTTGRMDYFGPMVNRAARVEGVAKGGQVVVSEPFFHHVKDLLPTLRGSAPPDVKCLGEFNLKGIKETMVCYEIRDQALKERVYVDSKLKPNPGTGGDDGDELDIKAETNSLGDEVAALERENDALIQELRNIGSNMSETEEKAVEMATALKRTDRVFDKLSSTESRAKLESLMESFHTLDRANNHNTDTISRLKSIASRVQEELTSIHSRIHMLQTKAVSQSGVSAKSVSAATEFLSSAVSSKQETIDASRAALARKSAQIEKLKTRVRRLLRDVEYLKGVNSGSVARRAADPFIPGPMSFSTANMSASHQDISPISSRRGSVSSRRGSVCSRGSVSSGAGSHSALDSSVIHGQPTHTSSPTLTVPAIGSGRKRRTPTSRKRNDDDPLAERKGSPLPSIPPARRRKRGPGAPQPIPSPEKKAALKRRERERIRRAIRASRKKNPSPRKKKQRRKPRYSSDVLHPELAKSPLVAAAGVPLRRRRRPDAGSKRGQHVEQRKRKRKREREREGKRRGRQRTGSLSSTQGLDSPQKTVSPTKSSASPSSSSYDDEYVYEDELVDVDADVDVGRRRGRRGRRRRKVVNRKRKPRRRGGGRRRGDSDGEGGWSVGAGGSGGSGRSGGSGGSDEDGSMRGSLVRVRKSSSPSSSSFTAPSDTSGFASRSGSGSGSAGSGSGSSGSAKFDIKIRAVEATKSKSVTFSSSHDLPHTAVMESDDFESDSSDDDNRLDSDDFDISSY